MQSKNTVVNYVQRLRYLVFMGELSEKIKDFIEHRIIPELQAKAKHLKIK